MGLNVQSYSQKIDNAIKSIVIKNSNLFEALNIRYFGPVDGHDVVLLVKLFEDIKNISGPKLLHIITKKGKGFKAAEENQTLWHAAPGKFDITTGKLTDTSHCENEPQKFQDIFGDAIIELAKANPKICAITPAMISGSSLCKMFEEFPERSFDVGISEQHAVTFAAGLAIKGMLPFCNIYSSFMQRAYDQVIHDVALQNLKVIFCLDRAGLVGQDGPTHHGSFDLSYMRCVPNLVIAAPRDEFQLRNLMFTLQLEKHNFPSVIRYPRGKSTQAKSKIEFKEWIEKEKIKDGKDIAILSIGTPGNTAIKLANDLEEENLNIAVFDMIFVKPLENKLLTEIFNNYKHIITIEDNSIIGGFGSAISEFMVDNKFNSKIYRFGIPDRFISHGSQQQLIEECEFDYNTLKLFIKNLN